MQKSKIIPFRILNSNHSEEAKLLVTNRKETRIRVSKKKNTVKSATSVTSLRTEDYLFSTPNLTSSSRPATNFSIKKKTAEKKIQFEEPKPAKSPVIKTSDNLIRLQNLQWEIKPPALETSPSAASKLSINPEYNLMSPSILPKIYSLRPFLMPFLTDSKHSELRIEVKSPENEKKVYWSIKDTWGDRPNGREGCQLVSIRNIIYIFGGQSRIKHTEVRSLDTNIWTWRILNTTYSPPGKLGHSLVPYKGKIVLYGGQSQHSQNLGIRRCSRKIYYLSINNKTWQHYSGEGEKPEGRRHHAYGSIGRFMVIYGGLNQLGHTLGDLYILDMKLKKWMLPDVIIQNDPGQRSHASLTGIFDEKVQTNFNEALFKTAASKGKMEFLNSGFYLFGGRDSEGNILNTLHGLYMREGKLVWTLIQNYSGTPPSPRYNHAASSIKNKLFIFGGRNDSLFKSSGDSSLDDLHCFNVSSLCWENLKICGSPPGGRWAHCMVGFQNKILMLGGLTTKQFLPADLYILESELESLREVRDEPRLLQKQSKSSEKPQINRVSLLDLLKIKNP